MTSHQYMPRFRGPSSGTSPSYHDSPAHDPRATPPYPATTTNLGGILTTDRSYTSTRSQILPNTDTHRRTDAPATYVHEYEIEIARWQARKRAKREQAESPLACSVCLEAMEPWVWVRPTVLCAHEPRICGSCLGQYVVHSIHEGLTEVLCPDVGCRHQMDGKDVVGYIREDPACLTRYNTLVAQRKLESHPNFFWCQNPRCGRGQLCDRGDRSLVICNYCHGLSCFKHRVPWHTGLTCKEYSLEVLHKEEIQASEDYIGKHTKQCPYCRRPIEKITGCDHMTCLRPGGCGHEFCWICLADYSLIRQDGNHRHNSDCKYYASDQGIINYFAPAYPRPPRIDRPPNVGPVRGWLTDLAEYEQFEEPPTPPTPTSFLQADDWEDLTEGEVHGWVWEPAPRPVSSDLGVNVFRIID